MSDLGLRDLAREVEPDRDLWPGIRAAASRRRWLRALAVAGVFAVIAAPLVLAIARPREPAVLRRFDTAARQYEQVRADLLSILADLEEWVDPASVRATREDLDILDRGIRKARQALARDPASALAALDLADRYLRDAGLLEDTVRFLARYVGVRPEGG